MSAANRRSRIFYMLKKQKGCHERENEAAA